MACRAGPHATERAEAGHTAPAPARAPGDAPTIVADRGVSHGTRGVWVETLWRSEVDPRGVIVVFSPRDAAYADLANRVLAEGFNHSFVESTDAPLAARVEFAATIANDKMLGGRQWLERAELRQPTITVLWFDAGEREAARTLLREHPPFRVAAAILVGGAGLSRRDAIALAGGGAIRVLEAPRTTAPWSVGGPGGQPTGHRYGATTARTSSTPIAPALAESSPLSTARACNSRRGIRSRSTRWRPRAR